MTMVARDTAQFLYDIEMIKQTKARYFRFLDGKQWSDWRTCFTDDMHFYLGQDPKPVTSSGDEFVAYVSKLLADTVTVHQGHMPEVELTSDTTATGIWAMFDWVDRKSDPETSMQGMCQGTCQTCLTCARQIPYTHAVASAYPYPSLASGGLCQDTPA